MDLQSGKSLFGDIKSKLGFGTKDAYDEYADDGYEDEYGDEGFDGYDDYSEFDEYSDDNYGSSRSRGKDRGGSANLVSFDDVRSGSYSSSFSRSSDRYGSGRSRTTLSSRTMVDSTLPPQMTPEGTAAEAASSNRRRSEGIDALFGGTDSSGSNTGVSTRTESAYSSREANTPSRLSPTYGATRKVAVIVPATYEDAERVTNALKAGDAAVLDLRLTSTDLMKRLLDFSFGAASALDAKVDCLSGKVYCFACGRALSDAERDTLRTQGLIS